MVDDSLLSAFNDMLRTYDDAASEAKHNKESNQSLANEWIKTTVAPLFSEFNARAQWRGRNVRADFGAERPQRPTRSTPLGKRLPEADYSRFSVVVEQPGLPEFDYKLAVYGRPDGQDVVRTRTVPGSTELKVHGWHVRQGQTSDSDSLLRDFINEYGEFLRAAQEQQLKRS